ncbi:MAG: 9-O-acetylesterase [Holophagae bacterium]|nr:MAG: 9-O-acetylesterase [Holophagae bacterium]
MRRVVTLIVLVAVAQPAAAELAVSNLFSNHMVLQRDAVVSVWGTASPAAAVTVAIAGHSVTATADADGRWRAVLPAMAAGGPHSLTVAGDGSQLSFANVLVGDVWVCSGQSNMEWTVADSQNAVEEIASATDPGIRHFKVPKSWAASPSDELAGGAWETADPEHVGAFTAVGYFFARELRRHRDVPIGLLNTSWGGSRIEPWMSAEALGLDAVTMAGLLDAEAEAERATLASIRAKVGELPASDGGIVDGRPVWAAPELDEEGWLELDATRLWEEQGWDGMDGIAWYRSSFELTPDEAKAGIRLGLGTIDDCDSSWVNGVEVGRTDWAWNRARVYDVPAAALRPGRNVVAIRVEDGGGGGGLYGGADSRFVEVGGARRPLPERWRFRIGWVNVSTEYRKNQVRTVLYNKMIHPLLSFPVAGFLWYQGESNANPGDAFEYRKLFATMIRQWRADWGRGDLPFLWVQLANFRAPISEPGDSDWAMLRESQSAALALPRTGQAVAIDIGDAADIHPRNKQEVGRRLALAARKVAYGEELVYSGPTYRSHEVKDGRVFVTFDHVGGGLAARGRSDGKLAEFAIAGADGRFVRAEAKVEGDRVVVWSEQVAEPVAVRYAWADNPEGANLVNAEGLPASPFRSTPAGRGARADH